jgi:hypothetical protein
VTTAEVIESQNDEKPILTAVEQLAATVIKRILFFLASSSSMARTLTLRILSLGFLLLQKQREELLPLIHQVWPTVIRRCHDTHHYVVIEALKLIQIVCVTSTDFVRKRVKDDVNPPVIKLLRSLQSRVLRNRTSKAASAPTKQRGLSRHVFSSEPDSSATESRLMFAILDTLDSILGSVPIQKKQADEFTEILVNFLDTNVYTSQVAAHSTRILEMIAGKYGPEWICGVVWAKLGAKPINAPAPGLVELCPDSRMQQFIDSTACIDFYTDLLLRLGPFGRLVAMNST